jgi:chloramphenicol O-acetyltransferase type A
MYFRPRPEATMPARKHPVDLAQYPRRAMFEAFKDRQMPCFSVTCNVEITELRRRLRDTDHRFFVTMSWILSLAVNAVPELRHRLIDGELVEFERIDPGFTVLLEDHTFSFCDAVYLDDFDAYHADALRRIEAVRVHPDCSTGEKHHMFFITSLPWLSFTAITHPFDAKYASIPVVTLGRYFEQGGEVLLPVGVQVHHGLADGWHVARFYGEVQRLAADPSFLRSGQGRV